MAKGDFKVPFDSGGNLLRYVNYWTKKFATIDWRDNTPFYCAFQLDDYYRYNHSCYILLKDKHDHRYFMNFGRFFEETKWSVSQNLSLQLEGWWRIEKVGPAYGVRRAAADELTKELARAEAA